MNLDIYQIDAFTSTVFCGNPACVVPLKKWLEDDVLLNIAKENAVAETAFIIDKGNSFHLRWFTPEIEMDLCGHATLAAAHCISKYLKYDNRPIRFETLSGELTVDVGQEFYYLNFPSRPPKRSELPETIIEALSIKPNEVHKARDYVLVYDSEEEIRNLKINRQIFDQINLDPGGVAVTAKGISCDFVSRFFTPQASILEDPVTGSSHCSLVPYWAGVLHKKDLKARQISERGGYLECSLQDERVVIGGQAVTYLKGEIWI